jgi:hypothetical protein
MTASGDAWTRRPGKDEHAPYYGLYIDRVPDGHVLAGLEAHAETLALLGAVPPDLETWSYAPGKWSIRDSVGHLVDVERTFSFRALCFSRGDPGPLPGMDQDRWVPASNAGTRPLRRLLDEWRAVRQATLHLFRSLTPEMLDRRGTASGVEFTVRSFAWIIAGHELHHLDLFRERYGLRP